MKTKQNYKIELNTYSVMDELFAELKKVCDSINIFKAGIGEIHVNLVGNYDGDCVEDIVTVSDVFHNFRTKGVRILKEYDRKQAPQKNWIGKWELIK